MWATALWSVQLSSAVTPSFWKSANLVLEVGLDGDLHAVRDAFAVFPHVVDQQVAERSHAVADWEVEVGDATVHLYLGGRACRQCIKQMSSWKRLLIWCKKKAKLLPCMLGSSSSYLFVYLNSHDSVFKWINCTFHSTPPISPCTHTFIHYWVAAAMQGTASHIKGEI